MFWQIGFLFEKDFAALFNRHLMWECVERCLSMCDRTLKNFPEKCNRNTVGRPPLYLVHHTKEIFFLYYFSVFSMIDLTFFIFMLKEKQTVIKRYLDSCLWNIMTDTGTHWIYIF